MPHFLYNLFVCLIFMCTFATATEKKRNKVRGDKIQGIPCGSEMPYQLNPSSTCQPNSH